MKIPSLAQEDGSAPRFVDRSADEGGNLFPQANDLDSRKPILPTLES
jgi:hypothetical protein